MKKFHSNSIKALAFSASALTFAIAGPAYAQDAAEGAQEEEEKVDVATDAKGRTEQGAIVVTGSRIRTNPLDLPAPILRLSQEDIATLVGLSRQRVNQEVQRLAALGVLDAAYGDIRIHDLEALRRAALPHSQVVGDGIAAQPGANRILWRDGTLTVPR